MSFTRRDFIGTSAAIGAAVFLNPTNVAAQVAAGPATLPKGVSKSTFGKAVVEFRRILGGENVLIEIEKLAPYSKIMIPSPNIQHQPLGALIVHSVEQIQKTINKINTMWYDFILIRLKFL